MTNEAMDNIISDDSTSGGEGETTYPERANLLHPLRHYSLLKWLGYRLDVVGRERKAGQFVVGSWS